ncbi:MAG: sensor histidine kinase [Anaerolineae bacterium]|nr:sensor histidine kinase [Anaerolineae bacterium]
MGLRRLKSLEEPPVDKSAKKEAVPLTPAQVMEQTHQEFDQIQKEIKEIDVLIKQSTNEVERLAQRNAQLTNKLRNMETNIDTVPRQDIKEIYTAAQEAQMRLFMMRGQVEQLQSKQEILQRFGQGLQNVLNVSDGLVAHSGAQPSSNMPKINIGEATGIIRIIDAQENERQHLANQLHDGPAQSLTNLILQAEICERLFDSDPLRARSELTELKDAVTSTFQKVREFIFDLRPMMLDDLGLNPTLKKSIEDYEQKTGIACNLTISGKDQRLPAHTEVTIFRSIQHLLNNVKQHAQATHVQIALSIHDDRATATVEDDGGGFNVHEALSAARQRKTIGLGSLQERLEMLGGKLDIDSSPGKGTRVEFWVPTT